MTTHQWAKWAVLALEPVQQNLSIVVKQRISHNSECLSKPVNGGCEVCTDLVRHLEQFLNMIQSVHRANGRGWLTVDDIASELKVSKSVVYQLIRGGELEAVNLTPVSGKMLRKGHYRIRRQSLDSYLQTRRVLPPLRKVILHRQSRSLPRVKNHLGL